jgi:hypothetical protein
MIKTKSLLRKSVYSILLGIDLELYYNQYRHEVDLVDLGRAEVSYTAEKFRRRSTTVACDFLLLVKCPRFSKYVLDCCLPPDWMRSWPL